MSGVLSMLRIESRRSIGLLCFPLLFAAAWWIASRGGMYAETFGPERFPLWLDTSKAVRDTVLFTGPLVAGLSAWMASRNKRRGMGELLSVTPRPSALRDLTSWAGTALWGMAAYTLIAAIFCLVTWWYATWGGPLLGWLLIWLLIGLLATIADSALGFAAGHFAPSRFTAPLVAVALFVGHQLPLGAMDYPLSFPLLSPVAYSNVAFDVFLEVPQATLQQSLWFTGLGATALCAVALGSRGRSRAAWIALMVSAAVCATGLITALSTDMYADHPSEAVPYEAVCEERTNITVCLHPAYASLLPQAARIANEVAEPLSGIPGAPRRVVQPGGHSNVTKNVAYFDGFGLMQGDEDRTRQEIAAGLVHGGRAMHPGPTPPERSTPPERLDEEDLRRCGKVRYRMYFDSAWEAQAVVGTWLSKRAGGSLRVYSPSGCSNTDELAARFASLEPDKRKKWLRENLADLRSGKITLKDLP